MFVETAQELVLPLLVEFDFSAQPEVDIPFEVLLHQEHGFVGIRSRCESGNSRVTVFPANSLEAFMNRRQLGSSCSQPWPTFQRMKAEPAFITEPALVDLHITAADGSVDLAIGG